MKRVKTKPFWIARDAEPNGPVVVTGRKPKLDGVEWRTPASALFAVLGISDFTNMFGVSLRPGEGPIKVTCRLEATP